MSELEEALDRLERAVGGLENVAARAGQTPNPQSLSAERDRLLAENRDLREEARRQADLRTEAADAVKDALSDLRSLMPRENNLG